jgi:hypothetical protein
VQEFAFDPKRTFTFAAKSHAKAPPYDWSLCFVSICSPTRLLIGDTLRLASFPIVICIFYLRHER